MLAKAEGRERPMTKIVNVYKLIGLPDFEQDQGKIEKAVKRVVLQQRQAKSEDPKKAAKLAKIFELAKTNLLNPKRKAAYDEQLRQLQDATPVQTSQQSNVSKNSVAAKKEALAVAGAGAGESGKEDWDWQALENVFPEESPEQPFDLADYLENAADPGEVIDGEAEYLKLRKLMDPTTPDPAEQESAALSLASSEPAILQQNQPNHLLASATPPVVVGAASAKPKVASIARKMRKKRDRSLLLIVGGVLASLAAVLLILFLIKDRPGSQQVADNNNPKPAIAPRPAVNPERAAVSRQGSGLPQVKGLEPGTSLQPMTSPMSNSGQMSETGEGRSNDDMAMQPEPPMPTPPAPKPEAPKPEPPKPESPKPSQVTLNESQKEQWKESMLGIRKLLGEQKFDEASRRLEDTSKLALTDQQKEQHARLVQLHELSKDFHAAMLKSIEDLSRLVSQEIKVKSTKVLFVEGSSESVTLRMSGRVDTKYRLTEIPIGIAYGIADLSLDQVNQRTAGRKAAFAIVHPMSNELVMPRARRFMSEAIAAKVVRDDMLDVFDDDYSLE